MKKLLLRLAFFSVTTGHLSFAQCYVDFDWVSAGNTLINFSDASTFDSLIPPTIYMWDFGDGGTSTVSDPSHTYQTPGVYLVCLTVYNGNVGPYCCSDSICKYVSTGKATGISYVADSFMDFYFTSSVTSHPMILNTSVTGIANITCVDVTGRKAEESVSVQVIQGINQIAIPFQMAKGIYLLSVQIEDRIVTKKIIW